MNQSTQLDDNTLKENLSRLSNLMSTQKKNQMDQKPLQQNQQMKKTIFMNLKFFVKPQVPKVQAQTQKNTKVPETTSTQSQTPKTITKQQMYRPQSMALFKQISEFREIKYQESSIKQDLSHYKDWVGLSVVDRNEIFQKKKQLKIKKLQEEKEQQIINACTFTPKLSQQIKYSSPQSQIINKSYLDLHKQKQNYNDKLY
ncbi:unnamed protein product [Paramecium primaurelia]|uniref:Uncharacterized protein n=1 Tax=Paramecium primaurelia TaxID=5886 RepID=A0A8S1PCC0_PARPR|nr:unnamed protein product [Paramecium primaurelia]